MKPRWSSRPEPKGRAAGVLGTTLVHVAAAALVIGTVEPPRIQPPSYSVELVAAPRPTAKKRLATEALPTRSTPKPPAPKPEKPAPKPPKKLETKPVPKPPPKAIPEPAPAEQPEPDPPPTAEEPTETPPPDEETEAPAETQSTVEPLPGETPSTGSDVANVKTPGLAFPYPEYLRNIVSEIYRRWDRGGADRSRYAEVSFFVVRDGSVRDIRFTKSSGNFAYDLNAQGAVEAAGNAHAFGPLPEGYEADVLPVTFYFRLQ